MTTVANFIKHYPNPILCALQTLTRLILPLRHPHLHFTEEVAKADPQPFHSCVSPEGTIHTEHTAHGAP